MVAVPMRYHADQRARKTFMNQANVTEFLNALSPVAKPVVLAIRKVIVRTAHDAEESVLWGGLSYHRPQVGGRVKGAVCKIGVKEDSGEGSNPFRSRSPRPRRRSWQAVVADASPRMACP